MTRSIHQDRVFQVQVTHVGVMLAVFSVQVTRVGVIQTVFFQVQVTRVGVMQTMFFRYKLLTLGSYRPCFSGTSYTRRGLFVFSFLFVFRYKLHALGVRRLPGLR